MSGDTAYDVLGDGPPVLLIHGLGLNRHMWQWQLDALLPQFRVIQYDLLGHGDSPKPPPPYSMGQMLAQIEDLMAGLDLQQCAVVGFSLGGLIAQAFALAQPRKVIALAILNSAHARTPEQRAAIMHRVQQVEESGPEATADEALKRWFSGGFARQHPAVLKKVRDWITANDRNTYPALYRLLAEADIGLETAIAGISCPTLVLTGEEDSGNSPHMAKSMAALMPNARVEILPGLRHMALAEDPAAVNSLLLSFLSESLR